MRVQNAAAAETDIPSIRETRQSYSKTRRQLIVLGLFPLSEAIAWTSIFPYIYAMVDSFLSPEQGVEGSNSAATYAGVMVSIFTFGEFVMAPQWARISDAIGRKPTLLIGSFGAITSTIAFGFSTSLPFAIITRACAGLANPNLGVVNTFVGELVSKDHQAKGFSVIPFLRGFGTIIGPVVGGYLAEPVKNYPSLFGPDTIWNRFPYLLPNLVAVVCLATSCTLGFLLLDEVHPRLRGRMDLGQRISLAVRNILVGRHPMKGRSPGNYVPIEQFDQEIELTPVTESEAETQPPVPQEPSNWREMFTKQVCLQILSSTILGYLKVATLATIPIFLATQADAAKQSNGATSQKHFLTSLGGLELDTQGTSNVLLAQAIASILTQILAVPKIIQAWGSLRSYVLALSTLIFVYCTIPFVAAFPQYVDVTAMILELSVYALVNGLGTTCSAILVTNTAPSPVYLARINGVCTSVGCLARTLGPVVSGPLFELGISIGAVGLPFWALAAVSGIAVIVALFLRDSP